MSLCSHKRSVLISTTYLPCTPTTPCATNQQTPYSRLFTRYCCRAYGRGDNLTFFFHLRTMSNSEGFDRQSLDCMDMARIPYSCDTLYSVET